jgi:hypothetical protein
MAFVQVEYSPPDLSGLGEGDLEDVQPLEKIIN